MLGAGFLHLLSRNVRKWRWECHRLPRKVAFLKFQSLIYFNLLLSPFFTFTYSFTYHILNDHLKYVRQFSDWKYNSETHKVLTLMVFILFTLQYIWYAKWQSVIGLWWKLKQGTGNRVTRDHLFHRTHKWLYSWWGRDCWPLDAWVLSTVPGIDVEYDRCVNKLL